jgi:hypothetical protein
MSNTGNPITCRQQSWRECAKPSCQHDGWTRSQRSMLMRTSSMAILSSWASTADERKLRTTMRMVGRLSKSAAQQPGQWDTKTGWVRRRHRVKSRGEYPGCSRGLTMLRRAQAVALRRARRKRTAWRVAVGRPLRIDGARSSSRTRGARCRRTCTQWAG